MSTGPQLAEASRVGSPLPLLSRLSVMMFLQYFVQGAYLPVVTLYVLDTLGFDEWQAAAFSAALSLGPIVAPFLVGQIVDRYATTEKVMAVCHFAAGILMIALYTQTDFWTVITIGTAYSVLYVPTMMLSNNLAFRHLPDRELHFPWVRLFGTIGFMVPAYLIEFWWLRGMEGETLSKARGLVFLVSGIGGLVMSAYCLTLPRTPPKPDEKRKYAPGAVLQMLAERHFVVFLVVSFFVAISHKFFWFWNSPFLRDVLDSGGWTGAYEQSISSIGQLCEIFVMALLGFGLKRYGFKRTMTVGAAAYAVRCFMFALVFAFDIPFVARMTLACLGQAFHGLCFGCFLAVGYMYVDRVAPRDARGSLQTFYGTSVIAVGFFVGGFVSAWVGRLFSTTSGDEVQRDWTTIWLVCGVFATICVIVFDALFPSQSPDPADVTDDGP